MTVFAGYTRVEPLAVRSVTFGVTYFAVPAGKRQVPGTGNAAYREAGDW